MKNTPILQFSKVSMLVLSLAVAGAHTQAAAWPKTGPGADIEALFEKLDRSDTLAGLDANANGVRDDIEHIITTRYTNLPQRRAAMQSARALQAAILVNTNDRAATRAVDTAMTNAISCLFERFPATSNTHVAGTDTPGRVSSQLESMTANTKLRVQAYLKFNAALDGTTSSIPDGSTCE